MSSIKSQYFYLNQLVEPPDMNNFYDDIAVKLSAYFVKQPCICSGLTYTQSGTSNTATFAPGFVRFIDQINALSTMAVQATYAPIDTVTVTITCPVSVTQYYIVAKLTKTVTSPTDLNFSAEILDTAMTLAEIAAAANPLEYIPLFTITNNSGSYLINTDSDCAFNYRVRLEADSIYSIQVINGNKYPRAFIQNVSGSSSNQLDLGWRDVGGVATPYINMNNQYTANSFIRYQAFVQPPVGGINNQYWAIANGVSSSKYAVHESYYTGAGNMLASLYATGSTGGNDTSGIQCQAGMGPLLPFVATLNRTSPNSVAVKSDITTNGVGIIASASFNASVGALSFLGTWYEFANGLKVIKGIVGNSASNIVTVTLPITFNNTQYASLFTPSASTFTNPFASPQTASTCSFGTAVTNWSGTFIIQGE